MKPSFEQVKTGDTSSVKVKTWSKKSIYVPLHYHPEYEIVLVLQGEGKLILPEAATSFTKKDILLVGSNVPHLYTDIPASEKKGNAGNHIKVMVIQFRENLFDNLLRLPEFHHAGRFLTTIQQGVIVHNAPGIEQLLKSLAYKKSIDRFTTLAVILERIAKSGRYKLITPSLYSRYINGVSSQRLRDVFSILQQNHSRDITVEEVAQMVHLSKTSLCRFLKKETNKTFSELLNEIRIKYACTLLRETAYTVKQVSYQAGFNNPSYFYRQFRKLQSLSPNEYKESNGVK